MTVYVDNALIPTEPGQLTSRAAKWSHLTADTPQELHAFASRLGLRREWFQDPSIRPRNAARPGSRAAENWHYDVTATVRARAIQLGAVPVTRRELAAIITGRYRHRIPPADAAGTRTGSTL